MKTIYLVTEHTQLKSEYHSFVSGNAVYTKRTDAAKHDKLMTYETALKDCYCTITVINVDSTDLDHLAEVIRCNIAVDQYEYDKEEQERIAYWQNLNKPKPKPEFIVLTKDNKILGTYPDLETAYENCPAGHYINTTEFYNPENTEVTMCLIHKPH